MGQGLLDFAAPHGSLLWAPRLSRFGDDHSVLAVASAALDISAENMTSYPPHSFRAFPLARSLPSLALPCGPAAYFGLDVWRTVHIQHVQKKCVFFVESEEVCMCAWFETRASADKTQGLYIPRDMIPRIALSHCSTERN